MLPRGPNTVRRYRRQEGGARRYPASRDEPTLPGGGRWRGIHRRGCRTALRDPAPRRRRVVAPARRRGGPRHRTRSRHRHLDDRRTGHALDQPGLAHQHRHGGTDAHRWPVGTDAAVAGLRPARRRRLLDPVARGRPAHAPRRLARPRRVADPGAHRRGADRGSPRPDGGSPHDGHHRLGPMGVPRRPTGTVAGEPPDHLGRLGQPPRGLAAPARPHRRGGRRRGRRPRRRPRARRGRR